MPQGFFSGSTTAQYTAPVGTVPQCGACGLFKGCHSPKMPVTGEGKRRILIVAEAPGEEEDKQGTQLIGKSGQHLRKFLRQYDVDLDRDCWKTNALICHPPKNAKPTNAQIDYCLPNLTRTVKELQPDTIIPLGGVAVRALLGSIWREDPGPVGLWVGWRIPCQALNAWVCPNYHPSYLLREEDMALDRWFGRYLAAAVAHEGRPWAVVPDYRKSIEVILNTDQAANIIRQMVARGGPMAFDYETNCLKPDGPDARIISCSICWRGKRTIAYPWHGEAITATREFIRSPCPKIASNMKFEERWTLKEFGHRVRNWHYDTMQGAHILDPRRGITSIKFQSFVHFGQPIYNAHIEPYLKSKGTREANQILREVSINDLLLYNGLDSLLEYMVAVRHAELFGWTDQIKELYT